MTPVLHLHKSQAALDELLYLCSAISVQIYHHLEMMFVFIKPLCENKYTLIVAGNHTVCLPLQSAHLCNTILNVHFLDL